MKKSRYALLLGFCFLVFCAPQGQSKIKVIVTTDVHGKVQTDAAKGEIGYALLKSYIDTCIRDGWQIFLMDSGDVFSGSAYAQIDRGRSIANLLGMMGYTAITPGNHAFDHNAVEENLLHYSNVLLDTLQNHSQKPVVVVSQNLTFNNDAVPGITRHPVVIYDETDKDPQGRKLIVTGLLTPYTARPSLKENLKGYDFGLLDSHFATRKKLLANLEISLQTYNRPQDIVIVLSHIGYAGPKGDREGRITGLDLAGVTNVDFVADGHTHTAIKPRRINQAMYANGGRYLENFLEIDLMPDGKRTMTLKSYADVAHLKPDAVITKYLQTIDQEQGLSEIICSLPAEDFFSDANLYSANIPLGRLICRAMLRTTRADMALHNLGGIRSGLAAGPITYREIYDVVPFGDELVTVQLDGEKILEIFNRGSGHGGKSFPQFYGFTVFAWRDPAGNLKSAGILDQSGVPLQPGKQYRVAMNGFMAHRTGFPPERHGELLQSLKNDLEVPEALQLKEIIDVQPLHMFSSRQEAQEALQSVIHSSN